jgi:hypothetical protein
VVNITINTGVQGASTQVVAEEDAVNIVINPPLPPTFSPSADLAPADASVGRSEGEKLFAALRQELDRRELSNSEIFDKAILAYSAGGLGLSLSFIKDIVPLAEADWILFLYASWGAFVLAIILVIASFIASQKGMKKQRILAERYYVQNDDKAFDEKNHFAAATDRLNLSAGICFILAIIATASFAGLNISKRTDKLKEVAVSQNDKSFKGGQNVPSMQEKRGAPVPAVQQKQPVQKQDKK